mmetsp:Transcript_45072/g.97972  ORF Transcript_45072/g.97972 Transcript_45072/m.97972 type:complete len:315 (-) Transcript_45072:458-1402(-)
MVMLELPSAELMAAIAIGDRTTVENILLLKGPFELSVPVAHVSPKTWASAGFPYTKGTATAQQGIAKSDGHARDAYVSPGINISSSRMESPVAAINFACICGNEFIVKLLLSSNANPDGKQQQGQWTPLFDALFSGRCAIECAAALLDAGATNIDAPLSGSATLLHFAVQRDNLSALGLLLAHRAHVDKPRLGGATPLYSACQDGRTDAARVLIGARADVNRPRGTGATPLHVAAAGGHAGCVKLLLAAQASTQVATREGETPLAMALALHEADAASGKWDAAIQLLTLQDEHARPSDTKGGDNALRCQQRLVS